VCRDCKVFQSLDHFNIRKNGIPYTLCRPCQTADNKKRAARRTVLSPDSIRVCSECFLEKSILEFPKNKNSAGGYLNLCKPCNAKKNSIAKWGVDVTQYSYCVICKETLVPGRGTVVDHDHNCCPGQKSCGSCVRGVLCNRCNVGLGMFKDSPALLIQAATYVSETLGSRIGLRSGKDGGPIFPYRANWNLDSED